ncbi:cytochrome P450 [Nocardioides aromaticivorans]|uniref:Cytochrome P450 n=1 Tax=Nocardioides aromaticivorans TaxID=200618 RepID=A0A7Y9ZHN1_9ACTN|nr:cytochrome P450 [Nocardioides aromaticivorans]NYI44453.1 cytochrome P450 [Nocardioides aromaticivorans]
MTTLQPTTDPLPYLTQAYRTDPYPFYAALRAQHPVHRHPDGFWAITSYDAIRHLLYDRTLGVAELDYGPAGPLHDSMLGADAPKHTRVRRTHSRWFTPRAVKTWTDITRAEVDARLEVVAAGSRTFDAVHDLAFPVTFATISHLLGVPDTDGARVRQATYDIGKSLGLAPTEEEAAGTAAAFDWFVGHIEGLIADKRRQPGDGLLDAFLAFEDEGTMSHDEVIASTTLLFAVGHLDITYLIAHGIELMAERPEIFDDYRNRPELREAIVNETLRLDTPEQFVVRTTTQPITLDGVDIPAGEVLVLFIGAGNRDPLVFAEPDTFRLDRDVDLSKHLAFGGGIHGCAGQVLARAEAHVVFGALTERFTALELAGPVDHNHSDFIRSITALPITVR